MPSSVRNFFVFFCTFYIGQFFYIRLFRRINRSEIVWSDGYWKTWRRCSTALSPSTIPPPGTLLDACSSFSAVLPAPARPRARKSSTGARRTLVSSGITTYGPIFPWPRAMRRKTTGSCRLCRDMSRRRPCWSTWTASTMEACWQCRPERSTPPRWPTTWRWFRGGVVSVRGRGINDVASTLRGTAPITSRRNRQVPGE